MGTERPAGRVFWFEADEQLGPEVAGGEQLGDLHEEVHADGEEKGQARREGVDVEPARGRGADVFQAVGEGGLKSLTYSRPTPDSFTVDVETADGTKFQIPLKAQ